MLRVMPFVAAFLFLHRQCGQLSLTNRQVGVRNKSSAPAGSQDKATDSARHVSSYARSMQHSTTHSAASNDGE